MTIFVTTSSHLKFMTVTSKRCKFFVVIVLTVVLFGIIWRGFGMNEKLIFLFVFEVIGILNMNIHQFVIKSQQGGVQNAGINIALYMLS